MQSQSCLNLDQSQDLFQVLVSGCPDPSLFKFCMELTPNCSTTENFNKQKLQLLKPWPTHPEDFGCAAAASEIGTVKWLEAS